MRHFLKIMSWCWKNIKTFIKQQVTYQKIMTNFPKTLILRHQLIISRHQLIISREFLVIMTYRIFFVILSETGFHILPMTAAPRSLPWGLTGVTAFHSAEETRLHVKSMRCSVCVQSGNIKSDPAGGREGREGSRRATDIPFTPVYKRQKGGRQWSRRIQATAARSFTLFSHSTRSTSGKWTCKGEERADHL